MNRKGFTFIEVLTVVIIASIVMLIVVLGAAGARSSARDDRRQADIASISSAIEKYRSDCGRYPTESQFNTAASSGSLRGNGSTPACTSGSIYTSTFSRDPQNPTRRYSYNVNASGSTYSLCASLEDAPVPGMSVGSCTNPCGSGNSCNYIVVNP